MAAEDLQVASPPPNSPTDASFGAAWVEKGTVSDVDIRNWTVDVVSEYSGKMIPAIHVMHPYFHTMNGEGFYAMPEIGSIVVVCFPSDNDPPFVMGFLSALEAETVETDNLEDKVGEGGVDDEEAKTPNSTASTGAVEKSDTLGSFRSGRPLLNPGDMMIKTRDDNFIIARRGGVIQIGSTPTCQSVWIPVLNYFRQFAENWEVNTPGGIHEWRVERAEGDPAGEAPIVYRLALRDKAQNDKADIQIKMGHVNDNVRYELSVAPKNIVVADGKVTDAQYKVTFDIEGNEVRDIKGSVTYDIEGDRRYTIKGNDILEVEGDSSTVIKGGESEEIAGDTLVTGGALRKEEYTGNRTVDAAIHILGPSPTEPAVLGATLLTWLASHVHPAPFSPSLTAAQLPQILSKRLMIPK